MAFARVHRAPNERARALASSPSIGARLLLPAPQPSVEWPRMNAAPVRLALALFCLSVVVVAATTAWAALAPNTDSGARAARTPTRSVVGAGSPLPMLQ